MHQRHPALQIRAQPARQDLHLHLRLLPQRVLNLQSPSVTETYSSLGVPHPVPYHLCRTEGVRGNSRCKGVKPATLVEILFFWPYSETDQCDRSEHATENRDSRESLLQRKALSKSGETQWLRLVVYPCLGSW